MEKKRKFPPVIIVFLVFVGFSLFSHLNLLLSFNLYDKLPNTLFLGKIGTIFYILISFIILLFIFIGTIKRKAYARIISLIYASILPLISLVNFIYYKRNPGVFKEMMSSLPSADILSSISEEALETTLNNMATLVPTFLFITIIFSLAVSILVIILMIKKKDYFYKPLEKTNYPKNH